MATKPIRFSRHARRRLALRGATEPEVVEAILDKQWQPALQGKWRARRRFDFGKASPANNNVYQFKIVEAIFADDADAIVVVTVVVYYGNEEQVK